LIATQVARAKEHGMATKRYGEGSVRFDDARGLWIGQLELEPSPDGQRRRARVTARNKDEMLAKMREAQRRKDDGLPVGGPKQTTKAWVEHWSTDVLPRSVKPSTAENYRIVLDAYVIPHVGKVPLTKLRPAHVERMMAALEAEGLSPRTVGYARAVLRRALTIAERQHVVARNVAALTDAPRKTKTKIDDVLDADQATAVLKAARGEDRDPPRPDRLEALAVLVLAVGLRQGEALALRWSDVDLKAGALKVTDAKTDAGVRTVPLPPLAVDALKAHRARQREERIASDVWGDPALVFASTVGTKLDRRNVLRWWHELTIRAGVGRRRFHSSRHTAATLMLNNGVELEVVSAILGHAGLAITADVYAKVGEKLQRDAADVMQGVLGSPTKRARARRR
jgi:integrase